jgi:arabinogalactan endo-1,4-beta-galactosidase
LKNAGATPDMVQIGNEIDNGMLWDYGYMWNTTGAKQLGELLAQAASAVRSAAPSAKIMIHLARGGNNYVSEQFFSRYAGSSASVRKIDFDVIGLSYYPYYESHGSLAALYSNMSTLKSKYGKDVCVAEVSYAWTTSYNDNTGNVFYTTQEDDAYKLLVDSNGKTYSGISASKRSNGTYYIPATVANQGNVIRAVIETTGQVGGLGVFYWGGCWTSGSSTWENQALFDFNNKALGSMKALAVKGW